ncbi:hypothetical protein [Bacillus sp. FJAT-29937]|uniref:hypothetical protein n=1 Tax=Bacillus sp. FJAT-29937 TaxID=1720553 RepID=UPI000B2432B0|nr:hypothetical protein [Bacillus sp. FJAT-29937]
MKGKLSTFVTIHKKYWIKRAPLEDFGDHWVEILNGAGVICMKPFLIMNKTVAS